MYKLLCQQSHLTSLKTPTTLARLKIPFGGAQSTITIINVVIRREDWNKKQKRREHRSLANKCTLGIQIRFNPVIIASRD